MISIWSVSSWSRWITIWKADPRETTQSSTQVGVVAKKNLTLSKQTVAHTFQLCGERPIWKPAKENAYIYTCAHKGKRLCQTDHKQGPPPLFFFLSRCSKNFWLTSLNLSSWQSDQTYCKLLAKVRGQSSASTCLCINQARGASSHSFKTSLLKVWYFPENKTFFHSVQLHSKLPQPHRS